MAPGYGTPLDPAKAPPKPQRAARGLGGHPGTPVEVPPPPGGGVRLERVALGFTQAQGAATLPPGGSPQAQNFLVREGTLQVRPRVAALGTNVFADDILWAGEYSTVTGARVPVALSARSYGFYSVGSWGVGSYGTNSVNDPLSGSDTDYIDACVVYHPTPDENVLVFVNGVDRAFIGQPASNRTYSTLSNAPIARCVTAHDSRVIFGNITDTSTATRLVQRVQWSERGNPEVYAEPTGGFEDLLDARGGIQRVATEGDRILVWFDYEIWQGFKVDFPFDYTFVPLDRTVGTRSPWSVVNTPRGFIFLGHDNRFYLLPKGGTPQPIGNEVWATVREQITTPERAAAEYLPSLDHYVCAFPVVGGSGRCDKAVAFNLTENVWTPHTFENAVTRFGQAALSSGGTTFAQLVGTFDQQTLTYGQLAGGLESRIILVGHSGGTMGQLTSDATGDLGRYVDSRWLTLLSNPNPLERQHLRELRLDYRAASASSLTVRVTTDFGQSYPVEVGVALPAAPVSGQTTVFVPFSGNYLGLELRSDRGHGFAVQAGAAFVERVGSG